MNAVADPSSGPRFHPFAGCTLALLLPAFAWSQQANVNLDWNPHQNTENLTPFSAAVNSPEAHTDRSVTFRVRAPEAKDIRHGYYVAGDSGHDWSTWRRLLYERFLPNLW